jgi:diguanylate cyclase (GGDEF)-like protein|uniref:Diguanylate cyclase with GAF sensor n=1 Tax=Leptospirillum sp. Group II '5-way CG' TaxID=419541 RepID=B6ALC1_9BACT|nr:MAG: Diguanylate cyclase with GAF sensor [Leptospirillum sp. Group II '5-way CG']
MLAPAIPANEADRLKALRALDILDTPPEERFDRLTRMARRLFNVPIALVTLVDEDRQWFKSNMGLAVSETPRSVSFCGHAILQEDFFIIPDARSDPRFSDNPLVLGDPRIRFYAGCVLRTQDNQKIGTLCLIDHEPRAMEPQDLLVLEDLTSLAEQELSALKMATMDELTGLSNRRGFLSLARHSLALSERHDLPMSLAFLDLDKFKPINDSFGHAEGDRALRSFADLMKRTFRTSDLIARLGGDEFVVLLIGSNRETSGELMVRLGTAAEEASRLENRGYDIAFSHGIVEFDPVRHRSIEEMLAEGDALMYQIKQKKGHVR